PTRLSSDLVFVTRGDLDGAMKLYQQSLQIQEQLGDLQGKSATLHQMAGVFVTRGDLDGAMKLYQQSLQVTEQLGDLQGKARTLSQMANVYWNKHESEETENLLRQSIELSEKVGHLEGAAYDTVKLGQVAQARGDRETALARYREGLAIFERLGMPRETAQVRELIAELEGGAGRGVRPNAPTDPLTQAIAQARAAAERGDVASAIVAQEQAVALMRQQGESKDALVALSIMLYNLGGYYAGAERFGDAVRAMQQVVALDERTGHQDLESDRKVLQQFQQLSALSPEELARLKAQQQAAQPEQPQEQAEEPDETDAQLEAQLAALPPEQRAQMEEAMRAFARMSPEEQAATIAQAQRAQIQSLADQVRDAGIAVRRGQAPRDQVLPQLEQLVAQIERDQPKDSPWGELAAFVRAVIVLLRGRASLILIPGQRAEPLPPVPAAYAGHLAAIQQSKG
ncbi:MAG: tetratricopeptide repeat protein, partial [Anaerolineales bacterium]|nr:tetratricopeptide repeat protein [Anaerolineales bacterium]